MTIIALILNSIEKWKLCFWKSLLLVQKRVQFVYIYMYAVLILLKFSKVL